MKNTVLSAVVFNSDPKNWHGSNPVNTFVGAVFIKKRGF